MSFDLYAFPPTGPTTVAEVRLLMEAEEGRLESDPDSPLPPPGQEMAQFLNELERRWPFLEDDSDHCPWSSWPLWQPMAGGGTALNIAWSHTDSMPSPILEIAARNNVIIYDPQADELAHP